MNVELELTELIDFHITILDEKIINKILTIKSTFFITYNFISLRKKLKANIIGRNDTSGLLYHHFYCFLMHYIYIL